MARFIILLVILVVAGGRGLAETDGGAWNQFRGPGGSGVAPASRPPVRVEAGCLAWKTPIATKR